MNVRTHRWRYFPIATALIAGAVVGVWAQTGNQNSQAPAGGKTSGSAADSTAPKPAPVHNKTPKPSRTSSSAASGKRTASSLTPVVEGINGKWWTTGNDFGTSQVFFEQNGTLVSGAIMYADGRTGTFSGVLGGKRINFSWTNTSGDRGTGWLEQSWNNFLGGTYRNQKGVSGSWTLGRIAGNWCLDGSRERMRKVNHSSRGSARRELMVT